MRKKRELQEEEDEVTDEEEEEGPIAPEKRHFDEEESRSRILKGMKEALPPPGEQNIKLSLGTLTETASNNPK